MRLIDADAFNDWILSRFEEPQSALILTLQGFIAEQPTAYSVDNVVEELEELRDRYDDGIKNFAIRGIIEKAIEIVKQGGVSDDVCEWKDTEMLRKEGICYSSDGLYKPGCNDDEDDFRDWEWIRHFKYCPYCGKKIKVVGD